MERYFKKIPVTTNTTGNSNINYASTSENRSTSVTMDVDTDINLQFMDSSIEDVDTNINVSQFMESSIEDMDNNINVSQFMDSSIEIRSNENNENIIPTKPLPTMKREQKPFQSFRTEWCKYYPWLMQKDGVSFCKVCRKTLTGSRAHLERHQQRISHKNKIKVAKTTVDVTCYLNQNEERQLFETKVKKAEYSLVMGLVEHNLPFLLMQHLPQLLKIAAPDSNILKAINCGRTKTTAIVKAMGEESSDNLKAILANTKFSVIIDETTDISVKKCLAILVRYVDVESKKVKDRLLSFVEVANGTADGLTSAVIEAIQKLKVPLANFIGFAADNANVMMGNLGGVQLKLRQIVNKDIFVVGCICHSMALCASNAANKLPREVEGFVRDIYNYLRMSSKKLQEFKEFQEFVQIKPHKILKLAQTRWLSLEAVVLRVLEQWNALHLYFQSAVLEDNLVAAEQILQGLQGQVFKLYLTFLGYILPLINKINLEFQSHKPKLYAVYDRIVSLYKTILKNYMKKEYVDNDKVDIFDLNTKNVRMYRSTDDMYLGEDTAVLLLNTNVYKHEIITFKNKCLEYYIELCSQIKSRFNSLKDYKDFRVLNPTNLLNDVVSLTPLLNKFSHLTDNNLQEIASEAREICNLPNDLKDKLKGENFQDFWFHLMDLKNSENERCFKNVCMFVFNIFSLPHSSAAAERTFSALNLIKSKRRNRLLPETCDSLLLAKELLDDGPCYSWEPSKRLIWKKLQYVK